MPSKSSATEKKLSSKARRERREVQKEYRERLKYREMVLDHQLAAAKDALAAAAAERQLLEDNKLALERLDGYAAEFAGALCQVLSKLVCISNEGLLRDPTISAWEGIINDFWQGKLSANEIEDRMLMPWTKMPRSILVLFENNFACNLKRSYLEYNAFPSERDELTRRVTNICTVRERIGMHLANHCFKLYLELYKFPSYSSPQGKKTASIISSFVSRECWTMKQIAGIEVAWKEYQGTIKEIDEEKKSALMAISGSIVSKPGSLATGAQRMIAADEALCILENKASHRLSMARGRFDIAVIQQLSWVQFAKLRLAHRLHRFDVPKFTEEVLARSKMRGAHRV